MSVTSSRRHVSSTPTARPSSSTVVTTRLRRTGCAIRPDAPASARPRRTAFGRARWSTTRCTALRPPADCGTRTSPASARAASSAGPRLGPTARSTKWSRCAATRPLRAPSRTQDHPPGTQHSARLRPRPARTVAPRVPGTAVALRRVSPAVFRRLLRPTSNKRAVRNAVLDQESDELIAQSGEFIAVNQVIVLVDYSAVVEADSFQSQPVRPTPPAELSRGGLSHGVQSNQLNRRSPSRAGWW